jgi:8-oxo-dGTP diphosphatase
MNDLEQDDGRWYPEQPMVGVGAVVLRDGRLLMVKRSREPSKGKWSIPGGRLELGETLRQAARREVLEECGIEVEMEDVVSATETILRDEEGNIRYHFVLVDLNGKYISGEPKAQSDAAECRWVAPEKITGLDMPSTLREMLKRQKLI